MTGARQIFLGSRRGPALPYDAEVEWLQSTGTEYIDTGLVLNQTHKVSLAFSVLDATPSSYATIFGARAGCQDESFAFFRSNGAAPLFSGSIGGLGVMGSPRAHNLSWHTATLDAPNATMHLDGAQLSGTGSVGMFTTPASAKVFGFNWTGGDGIQDAKPMRFASVRIWSGSTLVQDLIPVRRGGVGYMYDRVTGALLGNAASSGTFAFGPDKGAAFDASVLYLSSTGQWLDTGVKAKNTLRLVVTVSHSTGNQWLFGGRTAYKSNAYGVYQSTASQKQIAYGAVVTTISSAPGHYTYDLNGRTLYVDGTSSGTATASTFSSESTVLLGNLYATPTGWSSIPMTGNIYACRVWDGATLLRDFVPVRKNGVGYMYDVVSGSLFGNVAESGAFGVGADLTS